MCSSAPHRRSCNRRVAKSGWHPCNLCGVTGCGHKPVHVLIRCIDNLQDKFIVQIYIIFATTHIRLSCADQDHQ